MGDTKYSTKVMLRKIKLQELCYLISKHKLKKQFKIHMEA